MAGLLQLLLSSFIICSSEAVVLTCNQSSPICPQSIAVRCDCQGQFSIAWTVALTADGSPILNPPIDFSTNETVDLNETRNGFTGVLIDNDGVNVWSALNFTFSNVWSALNFIFPEDISVSCTESNGSAEHVHLQSGSPRSPPRLIAVPGMNLVSFDFIITPPIPPDCVVNYTITATSSDGSRSITVPAGEVDGSTPVNVGGFDVCARTYRFTVTPETNEGSGLRSISIFSGDTQIAGLVETPTGIEWLTLYGFPKTCFLQYIISLTADPTVTLTVNDTRVSYAALNAAGFPYCVSQEITVTPIVEAATAPSPSGVIRLIIVDPAIGAVTPSIVVMPSSTGSSTAADLSWEDDEQSRNRVVGIGRSSSTYACMKVRHVTEGTSTTVEFECDGSGQAIMPPCVQYFDGECSSMAFTANVMCSMTPPASPLNLTTPVVVRFAMSSTFPIGPTIGGILAAITVVEVCQP